MTDDELSQKFDRLVSAFTSRDEENFSQSLFDAQDSYNKRTPSQIYADMIRAQFMLFGGNEQSIRSGFDTLHPKSSDSDKAYFMAQSMRDALLENLNEDTTLSRIYNLIGANEEDVEQVWECLFAAATHYKTSTIDHKVSTDPKAKTFFLTANKLAKQGNFTALYELQKEEERYAESLPPLGLYNYWLSGLVIHYGLSVSFQDKSIEASCGSSNFDKKFEYLRDIRERENNFGPGHITIAGIAESQREFETQQTGTGGTTHHSTPTLQ